MLKTLFQNSRRPTSRYLEMTVILSEFAYANQISSKSYTFWVRFGALTISKWLPSAILDFRKLTVYVTWPFFGMLCCCILQKFLKSNDRLLSYVQKRFRRWRLSTVLNFKSFNFKSFNFWSRDCCSVCTKLHQNRTIFHWDMAIFKMAVLRHLEF